MPRRGSKGSLAGCHRVRRSQPLPAAPGRSPHLSVRLSRCARFVAAPNELVEVEVCDENVAVPGRSEWRQAHVAKRLWDGRFQVCVHRPDGSPDDGFVEWYTRQEEGTEWRRIVGAPRYAPHVTLATDAAAGVATLRRGAQMLLLEQRPEAAPGGNGGDGGGGGGGDGGGGADSSSEDASGGEDAGGERGLRRDAVRGASSRLAFRSGERAVAAADASMNSGAVRSGMVRCTKHPLCRRDGPTHRGVCALPRGVPQPGKASKQRKRTLLSQGNWRIEASPAPSKRACVSGGVDANGMTVGAFSPRVSGLATSPTAQPPCAAGGGEAALPRTALALAVSRTFADVKGVIEGVYKAGIAGVGVLLTKMRLEAYVDRFDEEGYDDVEFLLEMDDSQIDRLIADTELKPGHANKFRDMLHREQQQLRLQGSSSPQQQ